MLNPRSYLLPELARSLDCNSSERALASLALRNLWHTVFDSAPSILQLSPPDGKKLLEDFLLWSDDQSISMSWSLHVHLLNWLMETSPWKEEIAVNHIKELLVSSAARWAINKIDNIEAKGVLIGSAHLPNLAVGAWKSTMPSGRFRVVLLKIPSKAMPSNNSYVLSYEQNTWGALEWINLPK